ncbi:MAG TPA: DNA gyrase inhibitor YacG [Geminicoccus sp.]|uniref:DNA gyrase inhibitor YacG n=1 Tax=Geminicoccus sp. TaxID=2024832 RepID=UPI002C6559E1|nr:DNA gyrase inhibitor YacG [Geminicoccus sp.]HWL71695.1 DNA gyrase inhibitor YacG [Geminicoccus sp.]
MTDTPAATPRCPICGKPREQRFRPFCSRACRDRDFVAWADGRYAIPAVEAEEPDGDEWPLPERRQDDR